MWPPDSFFGDTAYGNMLKASIPFYFYLLIRLLKSGVAVSSGLNDSMELPIFVFYFVLQC